MNKVYIERVWKCMYDPLEQLFKFLWFSIANKSHDLIRREDVEVLVLFFLQCSYEPLQSFLNQFCQLSTAANKQTLTHERVAYI